MRFQIILKALFFFCFLLPVSTGNCLPCYQFEPNKLQIPTTSKAKQAVHVDIYARPDVKNAIFKGNAAIGYSVKLLYNNTDLKAMSLFCHVFTDKGEKVYSDSLPVALGKNAKDSYNFKLACKDPGFYTVSFGFDNPACHDSVKCVFGFNPAYIKPVLHKPDDFEAFWKETIDSLHHIAPHYKITEQQALSVNNKKVYLIEMHSWNDALIYGWLTIPIKRPGKIPVRFQLPGYLQKMEPDFDENEFAVFSLDVRGNGISRKAANTNGQYATASIEDRYNYIYRGVYMDCLRGLDFLCANAGLGLDTTRILVVGSGQGGALALVLAGLDRRVSLVVSQSPLYAGFQDTYQIALANKHAKTPVNLMVNYLRDQTGFSEEKLFKVWSYFDPLDFAAFAKCPVFIELNLADDAGYPFSGQAFFNQLKNKDDVLYAIPEATANWNKAFSDAQYFWSKDIFRMLLTY